MMALIFRVSNWLYDYIIYSRRSRIMNYGTRAVIFHGSTVLFFVRFHNAGYKRLCPITEIRRCPTRTYQANPSAWAPSRRAAELQFCDEIQSCPTVQSADDADAGGAVVGAIRRLMSSETKIQSLPVDVDCHQDGSSSNGAASGKTTSHTHEHGRLQTDPSNMVSISVQ